MTFESRDPGATAGAGPKFDVSALTLPAVRAEIGIGLVRNGAPPEAQFQTLEFVAQVQACAQACSGR